MKTAQDTMNTWAEAQQKLMSDWMQTARSATQPPAAQLWQQTLATQKAAVERLLETQHTWMTAWMKQMNELDGMPEEGKKQLAQGEALLKQWTAMQRQLWTQWFQALEAFQPNSMQPDWQREMQRAGEAWQEAAQGFMNLSGSLFTGNAAKQDS